MYANISVLGLSTLLVLFNDIGIFLDSFLNFNGEVTDRKLKEAILDKARRCGCDIDGDIISYEGNRYIVYLYTNTVIREER